MLKHPTSPPKGGHLNNQKSDSVGEYKHPKISVTTRVDFRIVPLIAPMKAGPPIRRKPNLDAAGKEVPILGEPFSFGWGEEWAAKLIPRTVNNNGGLVRKHRNRRNPDRKQ